MKIGFFVNDIQTEQAVYTTMRLAMTATNRGHEVWFIGSGDFTYDPDETIKAWATAVPRQKYRSTNTYAVDLKGEKAVQQRIPLEELDVLLLRNDPAEEKGYRTWAQTAGIIFGRLATSSGVIVLNDPNGLSGAMDKMYAQLLPETIRPRTIVTRDSDEIRAFIKDMGGSIVLKGLQGTGRHAIFLVTPSNRANLNQMIEAISRDGYVIAQEYLAAAEKGSVRLFCMNGEPLRYKGKYAAFQWVRTGDDMRVNIHASGSTEPVKLTDAHFRIAEAVRPRLVQDGMFLAGLHIVDDKLMDIHVFSPGGLGNAQAFEKVNFSDAVITALEHKVEYMKYYRRRFDNVDLATL